MASKVLLKMPAVNFNNTSQQTQQVVNKKGTEPVVVGGGRADGGLTLLPASGAVCSTAFLIPSSNTNQDPLLRITQLEQNIRFMHEQHQLMLASLHQEIETLRQRNRDLQFHLVFSKKNAVYMGGQQNASGSDSSPDDEGGKPKALMCSPDQKCNTQNLQVEMLEKDVVDLRIALNELTTKNDSLSKALDVQEKKLETALSMEMEYEARLEDAEKLIRRLRRENEDQKRELCSLRQSGHYNNKRGNQSSASDRHSAGSRRGGGGGGGASSSVKDNQDSGSPQQGTNNGSHRFPPLLHNSPHQQYWHNSQRSNNRQQHTGNGSSKHQIGDSNTTCTGNNSNDSNAQQTLPHLPRHYNKGGSGGGGNSQRHHSNRYYNNQHHYYNNNRGSGGGGSSNNSNNSSGSGNQTSSGENNQKQQNIPQEQQQEQ